MIQINFHRFEFDNFETLDDVINGNVKFCLETSAMRDFQLSGNDPRIKGILNNTVKTYDDPASCLAPLFNNDRIIRGTSGNTLGVKQIVSMFSKNVDGWILDMVEEPLFLGWNVMFFTKTSPYVDRFNEILFRLSESGVINEMLDLTKVFHKQFLRSAYEEIFERKELHLLNLKLYGDNVIAKWFYRSMTIVFLISCSLSCLVFFCEIIFKIVSVKLRKLWLKYR